MAEENLNCTLDPSLTTMDMSGWGRVSLYGEVLGITGNGHRQTDRHILLKTYFLQLC